MPWKSKVNGRRPPVRPTRRSPTAWAPRNCGRPRPTCSARLPWPPRPHSPRRKRLRKLPGRRPCRRPPLSASPRRKPRTSAPIPWRRAPMRTMDARITPRPPQAPNAPSAPCPGKANGPCCGWNRWARNSATKPPARPSTRRWRWARPTRRRCRRGSRPIRSRSPQARRPRRRLRVARPPRAPMPPTTRAPTRKPSRWPARPWRKRRTMRAMPSC
ncbi:hypothetical protein LMG3410_04307 [Achromobacter aegrifaciens]|nr:hypothetical protein LMG3410_04307 [Achromobacter aegrifaciens]